MNRMAVLIKGIPVTLYEKTAAGTDAFNRQLYEETPVVVDNVLVTPEAGSNVVNELQLSGKRAEYELSIPKGDSHTWEDRTVEFFGQKWHTIGFPSQLIESMVPLDWNRKIRVERYG